MQHLLSLHAHVLPSEHCTREGKVEDRLRHLFMLEQRVQGQESQLADQQRAVTTLRDTLASRDAKLGYVAEVASRTIEALSAELDEIATRSSAYPDPELRARADEGQRLTSLLRHLLAELLPLR